MTQSQQEAYDITAGPVDKATLDSLVADLGKDDAVLPKRARLSLVAIGEPAVAPLVRALPSKNVQLRWEAAKALGQIASRQGACGLVGALEDPIFGIRWLASEGLVHIGGGSLIPLIEALEHNPEALLLQDGGHRVLREIIKRGQFTEILGPVVEALESIEPAATVPMAARGALERLREIGVLPDQKCD